MTAVFVAAALLVVGGMAFAFALVRMADKPAPKPPLRLATDWEPVWDEVVDEPMRLCAFDDDEHLNVWVESPHPHPFVSGLGSVPGPYESRTVHGYRIPPTTDERGMQ